MKSTQLDRRDRIAGGLVGLLVGDALCVPYEFHPPQEIPPAGDIEYTPPPGFDRSHKSVQPGTWSDDGAQALCLLESLLECDRLDLDDFARRLVRWYDDGHLAVDGVVFDVGVATGRALLALRAGASPLAAGHRDGEHSSHGNGALMRSLPLALWHQGSDAELVGDARLQSCVTHGHMRSQVCCALYCLWARRILQAADDPWRDAVTTLRALWVDDAQALEELEWSLRPDEPAIGQGSGYVVDSLRSALWASSLPTYEQVVRAAIGLGRDTDTTACIAGGVAGLREGISAIPERWRTGLRGGGLYRPLLDRLLARVGQE